MADICTLENVVFCYLFVRNFFSPSEKSDRDCIYLFLSIYYLTELSFIISLLLKFIKIKTFIRFCLFINIGIISVCLILHHDFEGTFLYVINTLVFFFFHQINYIYHNFKKTLKNASEQDIKYDKTCVICFEELQGTYLVKFKCDHVFHKTCVEHYQLISNDILCPLCRC